MAKEDLSEIFREVTGVQERIRDAMKKNAAPLKDNPAFLLGTPGVGKTHMITSILKSMDEMNKSNPPVFVFDETDTSGKASKELMKKLSDMFDTGTLILTGNEIPEPQAAAPAPVDPAVTAASNGRAVAAAFRQGTGGKVTALRPARFRGVTCG